MRMLDATRVLAPDEAAAIIAAHQPIQAPSSVPTDGPCVFVLDSSAADGPFGPLRPFTSPSTW
jgi:hypothetical protein